MCFMLLWAVPVKGQAASQKTQVRRTIHTLFRNGRQMKTQRLEKAFLKNGTEKIFRAPRRFYRMIRPYAKSMRWRIKKVNVNGSKASVKVNVRFKSLYVSYWNSLEKSYARAAAAGVSFRKWKSGGRFKRTMLKALPQELQKNKAETVTTTIRIRLRRVNGKWKIAKASKRLLNIFYCNYYYTWYDYTGKH